VSTLADNGAIAAAARQTVRASGRWLARDWGGEPIISTEPGHRP